MTVPNDTQDTIVSRPRRSAGFFWGLAVGLLGALAVLAAGDLGWAVLPGLDGSSASAGPATGTPASEASSPVFLAAELAPGMRVLVDGKAVDPVPEARGLRIDIPADARKLEIRNGGGPLWSTRLQSEAADTLRPLLNGEIVVEVDRQGPSGNLYLDGTLVGTAPGAVAEVSPGWHILSIRDGERVLHEDAFEVIPGRVSLISVPPVPPRGKGRLIVRSRRLGEDGIHEEGGNGIIVDGEAYGETPTEIVLPAGFHSIRVERDGYPPLVEVIYLEAGRSRFVDAEFGGEPPLEVTVLPPRQAGAGAPVAIPVRVTGAAGVTLSEGHLCVVRPGQSRSVNIPLVPSGTDDSIWLGLLPGNLVSTPNLSGFASCVGTEGRRGASDIFRFEVR